MTIIRLSHLRELKYCSAGIREFFRSHDLDYSTFLAQGVSRETLIERAGDDAMVQAAIEEAERDERRF